MRLLLEKHEVNKNVILELRHQAQRHAIMT